MDFEKLTVVQLKEQLRAKKLPVSGKKADLIARLKKEGKKEKSPSPLAPSVLEHKKKVDYSKLKVVELKILLKEKKLPVSGTKAVLIERLTKATLSPKISSPKKKSPKKKTPPKISPKKISPKKKLPSPKISPSPKKKMKSPLKPVEKMEVEYELYPEWWNRRFIVHYGKGNRPYYLPSNEFLEWEKAREKIMKEELKLQREE